MPEEPAAPYPDDRSGRDRWVLARRDPRLRRVGGSRPDPGRPTGVAVEWERGADGVWSPGWAVFLMNRECPWRCLMCDLWQWAQPGHVRPGAIVRQVRASLVPPVPRMPVSLGGWNLSPWAPGVAEGGWETGPEAACEVPCSWIKLYNAGSFFDAGAVPRSDWPDLARLLREHGFRKVIVESHPALVNGSVLRFRDLLGAGIRLEVALGLETVHEEALERLNKRMTVSDVERATRWLRSEGIDVRLFLLIQPPFIGDPADAVTWVERGVVAGFGWDADVISLIPMRPGNGAIDALLASGDYRLPGPAVIREAWDRAVKVPRRPGQRILLDFWDMERWLPDPQDRWEWLRKGYARMAPGLTPSVNG